jgi:TIR domain/Carbohydrate binding module (family 35)
MTNFFISYNHADADWAEWIAWQLEEAGYTTILQAWDFRPSQNFVIKMNDAIRASERMIAVLSPDYMDALFSSPEWAAAFARDPRGDKGILLPVRVRLCNLSGLFDQIIHIDLVGKDEWEARKALLAGIQTERAKPLSKPKFPRTTDRLITKHPLFPGPRIKRRFKSVRALVIFVAVLIVVVAAFWPSYKRWREPVLYCPKVSSGEVRYYEAEDADLWGSASRDSEHPGFSGDGYVSGYGAETEAVTTFSIDVPSDGQYQLDLCYSNATKSAKMLSIYVNEVRVKQTRLPNASRWNIWLIQSETLPLKAGNNKISYRKTTGDSGQVNLDFIGISKDQSAR